MAFKIQFDEEALRDLEGFPKPIQATVFEAIVTHLSHQPALVSRSRIKRLRGLMRPQYRLRVDEVRVFYDIDFEAQSVNILAVVDKAHAALWLEAQGIKESDDENH